MSETKQAGERRPIAVDDGGLRVATAEDREGIRRLVNAAFVVERRIKRGGGDRLAEQDGELEALMERGVFLVQEEEDGLVATVYLEPRGERCYLGLLSIVPERQGAGLARRMMGAAEQYARERGCLFTDLRVVSPRRDELVPLYRKLGYAEDGTEAYPEVLVERMVEPGHFIRMAKAL